jgi:hypothetical protein
MEIENMTVDQLRGKKVVLTIKAVIDIDEIFGTAVDSVKDEIQLALEDVGIIGTPEVIKMEVLTKTAEEIAETEMERQEELDNERYGGVETFEGLGARIYNERPSYSHPATAPTGWQVKRPGTVQVPINQNAQRINIE